MRKPGQQHVFKNSQLPKIWPYGRKDSGKEFFKMLKFEEIKEETKKTQPIKSSVTLNRI